MYFVFFQRFAGVFDMVKTAGENWNEPGARFILATHLMSVFSDAAKIDVIASSYYQVKAYSQRLRIESVTKLNSSKPIQVPPT